MNPQNPYPPAAPDAPTHPELLIHTLALDVDHFNGPDPLPVRNERMRTRLKARMNELSDKLAADIIAGRIKLPVMLKARLYLTPAAAPVQSAPAIRTAGRPLTASKAEQAEPEQPAAPAAADDFSVPEPEANPFTDPPADPPEQPAVDDDEAAETPQPDPKRSTGQLQTERMRKLKSK